LDEITVLSIAHICGTVSVMLCLISFYLISAEATVYNLTVKVVQMSDLLFVWLIV